MRISHSESWDTVLGAFRLALGEVKDLTKTEVADTGKYSYQFAPLPVVLDEVKRVINAQGLVLSQMVGARKGNLTVSTTLLHESGEWLTFPPMEIELPKEAQALGSAMTYLRRYSLLGLFGIATEDDDGLAASPSRSSTPQVEITKDDPHCPACLDRNGELVALTKERSGSGKDYWRCSNRGKACAGYKESGGNVYSLSLWVESGEDPNDWKALYDKWMSKNGTVRQLDLDKVGPEVVLHVRDEVLKTTGTVDLELANLAVYTAVTIMDDQGLLSEETTKKGDQHPDDLDKQRKAMAMTIPMSQADVWIAVAAEELLGDLADSNIVVDDEAQPGDSEEASEVESAEQEEAAGLNNTDKFGD